MRVVDAGTVKDLDYTRDVDDEICKIMRRDAEVYETTIAKLEAQIVELESKVDDRDQLVASMQATIDDLQSEVDDRGDDGAATRNRIALLERDVEKWRILAAKKVDGTS